MKGDCDSSKSNGSKKVNDKGRNGEPISLYPLSPEEAMRAILQVAPKPKNKQQSEQAKKH